MNVTSSSRTDGLRADQPVPHEIFVWDLPVRLFHWLMVFCFAGAYLTAESERWRLVHVTLGYTMVGLVVFRLVWGIVGTRYARFASFVREPKAVASYLRSLMRGKPEHPEEGIRHAWRGLAAIMLIAVLGFWWLQWQSSPPGTGSSKPENAAAVHKDRDHDDD